MSPRGIPRESQWLRELYGRIATQLRFSLYEVETEADVGVIFEVMNNRGKALTELEKVKNYLLHAAAILDVPNELTKSVNEAWSVILTQLMAANLLASDDEDRLLRAHWLTHYDFQPRKWEGSNSIKSQFDLRLYGAQAPLLLTRLHQYTQRLREASVKFCDVYQPFRPDAFESFSDDPEAKRSVVDWSAKLVRVGGVPTFLPLLFALRERWPTDARKYLEILKLCETYAFRVYRLRGARTDAGQATLFRLGYAVADQTIGFATAVLTVKAELARRCADHDFTTAAESRGNKWYDWDGLLYFLYEYEMELALRKGVAPKITWQQIRQRDRGDTIEHVLPQSMEDHSYWTKRFTTKEHQLYVHDLGNLALTRWNQHYSNKPFPDKKGIAGSGEYCYAEAPFFMEQELAVRDDWDITSIEGRRNDLFAWASRRWAIHLSPEIDGVEEAQLKDDEPDEELDLVIADGGIEEID